MKIAFISSESLPYSKVGGLADVVYGLGKALAKQNQDITIVTPLYHSQEPNEAELIFDGQVKLSWRLQPLKVYKEVKEGITYLLIANNYYYARNNLYGYDDDIERFAFFDLAFIELIKNKIITPEIVHIHDWETAMIPLLLKEAKYSCKTVFTIHNPAFQGNAASSALYDYFNLPYSYYEDGTCRFHSFFSCLKTGIVTSDYLTTVSKNHAKELIEDEEKYNELAHIIKLRKKKFIGIVNGVDEIEFDPKTDTQIFYRYNNKNYLEGKLNNKRHFETVFGLAPSDNITIGMVSRLTEQKGLSFLPIIVPWLVKNNATLTIIGSGQKNYEQMIKDYAKVYPSNVFYFEGYSTKVSHLIYASSDFFLMPSIYEPCGIGQLIAKKYGTLPIVSSVGGLKDTVIPYTDEDYSKAEGFSFNIDDSATLIKALDDAKKVFEDKKIRQKMGYNAMKAKSSWNDIVKKYLALYNRLLSSK